MTEVNRIGPVLATAIVAGNMIGSGVFLLPSVLANVGSSSLIGWALAAAVAAALALVCALIASVRPGEEALTDYPSAAFHPLAGFAAWVAYWSANVVGNTAIVIVGVAYGAAIFGLDLSPLARLAAMLAAIWALAFCAYLGPRLVGRLSSATLVIGLAPIVITILLGLFNFDADLFLASWKVTQAPLIDSIPPTMLTIFWAFLGLESANAIAPLVRDPKRNVAIAAIGGVALSALVYASAMAALFGLLPAAALAASSAPFTDAVKSVAGGAAGALVGFAAFARTMGCTAGWMLVTAETARAGARRGFLPKVVSTQDMDARPRRDILLLGALMSLTACVTVSPSLVAQFSAIADFTVYLFLFLYALTSLALVRFADAFPRGRARFGVRVLGLFGAVSSALVAWAAFTS